MIKLNKLAVGFAAASMVVSMSAFAETRHRDDTDNSRGRRDEVRSERRNESRNETRSENRSYRNDNNRNSNRNDNRSYRNENNRNDNRSYRNNGSYRNNDSYRYDNRNRYSTRGRISRIEPWRGGFRVYVGGGYPFFVTDAWYRAHRLRVGVEIGLGGIWNSGGYYDVYDDAYGYNAAGDLRGVVETVDYRRGTAVVRDDLSGSFVTIVLRGGDRRLASMRPGDYVTLGGEWSRAGVFNAYNLLDLQYGRY